jgi:hypothetical protein
MEPLIRIILDHNTDEDACYFYNRLEGDQVRWVSYHYRGEPGPLTGSGRGQVPFKPSA